MSKPCQPCDQHLPRFRVNDRRRVNAVTFCVGRTPNVSGDTFVSGVPCQPHKVRQGTSRQGYKVRQKETPTSESQIPTRNRFERERRRRRHGILTVAMGIGSGAVFQRRVCSRHVGLVMFWPDMMALVVCDWVSNNPLGHATFSSWQTQLPILMCDDSRAAILRFVCPKTSRSICILPRYGRDERPRAQWSCSTPWVVDTTLRLHVASKQTLR
jgi:hypothetical protein